MRITVWGALTISILCLTAACGGQSSPNATATPTAVSPTVVPPAEQPTEPGEQPTEPGAQPTEPGEQPTAAPGGTIDTCALVSADEFASVTGAAVTGSQEMEMAAPFAGCLYQDASGGVGIVSLSPDGGMWDMVWSQSGLLEVAGIGDAALWEENTASLVVDVGDWILSVNAGTGADDLATRLEWAKELALIAVSRM